VLELLLDEGAVEDNLLTEEEEEVPMTPEVVLSSDDVDETLACCVFDLSFSSSWNLEIRFTRLVVSARLAYIVFGRSFLSLRCMALWVGPRLIPEG